MIYLTWFWKWNMTRKLIADCQELSSLEHDTSWHKWAVSGCQSTWTCGHLCHAIVLTSDLNSPLFGRSLDNNEQQSFNRKSFEISCAILYFNRENSFSCSTVSGSRQTIHRPILYNVSDVMCLSFYWVFSNLIESLSQITLTKSIMRQRKRYKRKCIWYFRNWEVWPSVSHSVNRLACEEWNEHDIRLTSVLTGVNSLMCFQMRTFCINFGTTWKGKNKD